MKIKPLTTKESEVLILLYSYSDEGEERISVAELVTAAAETHDDNEDDWDWHDCSAMSLGSILRILEARSLVISDGRNPATWRITGLGLRYMNSIGDENAKQRLLQEGYEHYIASLDASHNHSSVRT